METAPWETHLASPGGIGRQSVSGASSRLIQPSDENKQLETIRERMAEVQVGAGRGYGV